MDKAKGVLKSGWHPAGDSKVHRDTWKSDLKGIATGKTPEKKQLEASRSHQSAPLASLKDPDTFGPPPKHTGAAGSTPSTPISPTRTRPSTGGLGAPVPKPQWRQEEEQVREAVPEAPKLPYRTNTTGLRTDNLPKPPARRGEEGAPTPAPAPAPPPRTNSALSSPPPPVRAQVPAPPRSRPTPGLPPRMNEHPDEHTPPAPPPYNGATQPAAQSQPLLNQSAVNRLAHAGVSVPGFGIQRNNDGTTDQAQDSTQGHPGQLSELQQRFARMTASGGSQSPVASAMSSMGEHAVIAAGQKKPPPPPPPKKSGLVNGSTSRPGTAEGASEPPPLPLSSKPRPP